MHLNADYGKVLPHEAGICYIAIAPDASDFLGGVKFKVWGILWGIHSY
jgi:hypothetical protein